MSTTQSTIRTIKNDQARPSLTPATRASTGPLTLSGPPQVLLPGTTQLEGTPISTVSVPKLPPLVLPIVTRVQTLPTTSARFPLSTQPLSRTRSSSTSATATTITSRPTVVTSASAQPLSTTILGNSSILQPSSATLPSTVLSPKSSAPVLTTTNVLRTSARSTSSASVTESNTVKTSSHSANSSSTPSPPPTRSFVLRSIDTASPATATRTLKSVPGRRTPIYRQSNSSSLAGGRSPPGEFEQLTDDGDVTCEVQDPNSLLSFVAILLVIFGFVVCGHFFSRTLKEWMVFHDQQQKNGGETDAPKSPLPAPISLSPKSRQRRGSVFKRPDPDSDVDSDADTVIVDESDLPPDIQAKHAKLRASLHGMSHTPLHRRPSTRTNSSSSSHSSSISRAFNVPTLLLVAWSLYLIDQVLYATVLGLLYWVCPEYNCWSRTPLLTPNCPTMPELFTAYVAIQPVASGVFVTAVMLMFMRIFSVLSPRRRQALYLASVIVILVTFARLITLAASQYVRRAPETWPPGSPTEVYVWKWYSSTALAGSLLNAVLVKLALIMALGYISGVRADVCALRQSVLSLTVPPGASIMLTSHTSASPAVAARPLSTPRLSSSRSRPSTPAAAGSVYATLLATAEKCESIERRAVRARRWIVTGIIVITGVVAVNLHQKFAHEGMPVQVCNAIYATIQVGFAGCVSMAMAGITQLISGE